MKKFLPFWISIIAFIWFGWVIGISFMEAPLKFQAPDITLALGLGIGRIVFHALNKVEIALALLILAVLLNTARFKKIIILFGIIALILLLQTFWLLPVLDARAEIIIQGKTPSTSHLHLVYIVLEAIKLISLFWLGIVQMKLNLRHIS